MKTLFLMLLIFPQVSHGFTLTISNRSYGNPAFQSALDTLADTLQTQFNSAIASASHQSDFLTAMGNANAMSARSYLSPGVIPADRNFFMNFGGSFGLALGAGSSLSNGITFPQNQLPPIGISAKTGVSVGVSAKKFPSFLNLDSSRLMYTASFYSSDLSGLVGHGVTLKTAQASLGMSYQFYPSQHWSPLVRFNGFKVSSGLSYSTFDASFATPFNLTQGDGTYDMTWNNTVNVGVSSSVWSFTNEATAGIAVLGVVNLYAGVGLDFNVGSTAVVGGSAGPVTAVQSGTSTQVFSGTATISSDSSGVGPTFAQTRFLLGTEFGVGPVGLYLQGQVANPSTYGLNFGAHFLF